MSFIQTLSDYGSTAAQKWQQSRSKYKKSKGEAPPDNLVDVLYGATKSAQRKLREGSTTAFLRTEQGKAAQAEAERQTVLGYAKSPMTWIAVGAGILLIGLLARGLR